MKLKINLNADIAEGYGHWNIGNDEALLNKINTANIACGKHAGDENIMRKITNLCIKKNVDIGAHPGFSDLEGFGRRKINLSERQIENLIAYQIGALLGITLTEGCILTHVKPHGALNNMACKDISIANSIIRGFKAIDKNLFLLAPTNSMLIKAGLNNGIKVIEEGFADRSYMSDGSLSPRSMKGSVITDTKETISQAMALARGEPIQTLDGNKIVLPIKSICIHGDNNQSLKRASLIKKELIRNDFKLVSLTDF